MKTKKELETKKPTNKLEKSKIQIISFEDNPDGSYNLTYEINDAMIEVIGKDIGKIKPTKNQINKWILNVLEKAANEEDGYKLVKEIKKGRKK